VADHPSVALQAFQNLLNFSPKLLEGDRGRITSQQIALSINPDDIHFPKSSLVVLENTMNKGGGSIYALEEIKEIRKVCDEKHLSLHLDGARLFNGLVESGDKPISYGQLFDTISICFSKGLGAPVGSVLLGSREKIKEARRVRKALGGAMRQAGYLAAACMYALDHHIERLKEDHQRARDIGIMLESLPFVTSVLPVDTNIVIAQLHEDYSEQWFLEELKSLGVLAVAFGSRLVRFVTHLDFSDDQLNQLDQKLKTISS